MMIYFATIKFNKEVYERVIGFTYLTFHFVMATNPTQAKRFAQIYYEIKYAESLREYDVHIEKVTISIPDTRRWNYESDRDIYISKEHLLSLVSPKAEALEV